jgi:hypothetical protein
MSDIEKCTGKDCPVKDDCKRFTAQGNDYYQSWLTIPPFKIVEDKFKCEMYWGANAQAIWNELLNATKKP